MRTCAVCQSDARAWIRRGVWTACDRTWASESATSESRPPTRTRPASMRQSAGTAAEIGDSGYAAWAAAGLMMVLNLMGGQSSEVLLSPAAVVSAFDPGHDRDPQLVLGGPSATVEDVVLQQSEEALHGRVVSGRVDPGHLVRVDRVLQFPQPKLAAPVRVQDTTSDRLALDPALGATALSRTATARRAFIRESIE